MCRNLTLLTASPVIALVLTLNSAEAVSNATLLPAIQKVSDGSSSRNNADFDGDGVLDGQILVEFDQENDLMKLTATRSGAAFPEVWIHLCASYSEAERGIYGEGLEEVMFVEGGGIFVSSGDFGELDASKELKVLLMVSFNPNNVGELVYTVIVDQGQFEFEAIVPIPR